MMTKWQAKNKDADVDKVGTRLSINIRLKFEKTIRKSTDRDTSINILNKMYNKSKFQSF